MSIYPTKLYMHVMQKEKKKKKTHMNTSPKFESQTLSLKAFYEGKEIAGKKLEEKEKLLFKFPLVLV